VLPLLLLAGCTETLDRDDLEAKLKREIGARAESVSCPEDVEVKKGKTFSCTVTESSGGELRVRVTILDEEGRLRVMVPPQQGG
jgi:hypothetical protein